MTHRLATFTEANAWVHLAPDQFTRLFPSVTTIWQAEDGRVWVQTDGVRSRDEAEPAWWELEQERRGEAVLPCGCQVHVHCVPHARGTICTFRNPTIGFHRRLRISGRLMLSANALSGLKDAVCVHPHDERTVEEALARSPGERCRQA